MKSDCAFSIRGARRGGVLLTALLLAGVPGCSDDRDCPSCPPPTPMPTFENIWPDADSLAWTYAYRETMGLLPGGPLYPTEEEVPPAPPMDSVIVRLREAVAADSSDTIDAFYRLRFLGWRTTESGKQGRRVEERMFPLRPSPVPRPSRGTSPDRDGAFPDPALSPGDPLLRRLVSVRPDLGDRVLRLEEAAPRTRPNGDSMAEMPGRWTGTGGIEDYPLEFSPVFLTGYAWARTDDRIGSYGDLDTLLSWVYLVRDLSPGVEFTHQILPRLADDIFLHGRITRGVDVHLEGWTYRNCIECVYLLDYGISVVRNEQGTELGFTRMIDIGSVTYAPEVGPIQSREYRAFIAGEATVTGVLRLDLVGAGGT